jgi:hypothetical protein
MDSLNPNEQDEFDRLAAEIPLEFSSYTSSVSDEVFLLLRLLLLFPQLPVQELPTQSKEKKKMTVHLTIAASLAIATGALGAAFPPVGLALGLFALGAGIMNSGK